MSLINLCRCTGRDGFTRDGEDMVCSRCGLPRPMYETKVSGGLAYFRGGPIDGHAYSYDTLLMDHAAIDLPIMEYRWTREKITSEKTGATARVWIWVGAQDQVAGNTVGAGEHQEAQGMSQNTTTEGITNTQLLERRLALKLSRPVVATKADVSVATLANMENSGKRVKPGVMDKVHAALTHFESQNSNSGAPAPAGEADDKESHTSS